MDVGAEDLAHLLGIFTDQEFGNVADYDLSWLAPLDEVVPPVDAIKQETSSGCSEPPEPPHPTRPKRGRPKGTVDQAASLSSLERELVAKMGALDVLQQENQRLNQNCSMLELVAQARAEQVQRLQSIQAGQADTVLGTVNLSAKALGEMKLVEMAQRTKDLMQQVGAALLKSESDGDTRPLMLLMSCLHEVVKLSALLRPDRLLLCGQNLIEMCACPEDVTLAPEEHWREVVGQMCLGPEQCRQVWVLSELSNRWLARLMADRAATSAALAQLLSVNRYGHVFDGSYLGTITDTVLLDRLHDSLTRERCLIILVTEVFRKLLHPKQLAQLVLHSYPYCPDDMAILHTAAARHAPPTPVALQPVPHATLLPPAHPDPNETTPPLDLSQATPTQSNQHSAGTAPPVPSRPASTGEQHASQSQDQGSTGQQQQQQAQQQNHQQQAQQQEQQEQQQVQGVDSAAPDLTAPSCDGGSWVGLTPLAPHEQGDDGDPNLTMMAMMMRGDSLGLPGAGTPDPMAWASLLMDDDDDLVAGGPRTNTGAAHL